MPDATPTWKQKYGPAILWIASYVATCALGALAGWLNLPAPPPVVVERFVPAPERPELDVPASPDGWVIDPDEVALAAERLQPRVFAATPAGLALDVPKSVYLWKAYPQGKTPVKDQGQVGSCVSFGTNTAVERTLAAEIAAGRPFDWSRFAEEVTYAGSRVEVGQGRIRGDGSIGAWAARFVKDWGLVPRGRHGQYDLSAYDEGRCREWGRLGVPDELEAVARDFPVKDVARIKDWADAKKALASGYAVAICSNQGFARQRDANGVARPSGSWAHCMCLDGYHTDDRGREYGHLTNSWGDRYHIGPVGWGEPGPDGFWAEATVIDRMLRQGDSWTFSGVTGFPRKKLDWLIRAEPAPRLNRALARPEFALAP
jgi:hypothetical protein